MSLSQQPRRADTSGTSLGILLGAAPQTTPFERALSLLEAAFRRSWRGYLYLIADALEGLADTRLQRMRSAGLSLFACGAGARERRIEFTDQAVFCGLAALSDLISRTDRFLVFPPLRRAGSSGKEHRLAHGGDLSNAGQSMISSVARSGPLCGVPAAPDPCFRRPPASRPGLRERRTQEPFASSTSSEQEPAIRDPRDDQPADHAARRRLCLIIDPAEAGWPPSASVEAMRIAEGVAPWRQVSVEIRALRDPKLRKQSEAVIGTIERPRPAPQTNLRELESAEELAGLAISCDLLAWF